MLKKQSKFVTIAAILLLASPALIAALPFANAHSPAWNIPTWMYVSVSPNPIGVNQQAFIVMWLNVFPPTANGEYGDRWQGYTVTVTKPDGTTQSLGPFSSDPVGSAYAIFTPDQPGNYNIQAKFPGQTLTGANPNPAGYPAGSSYTDYLGDNFQPSTSPTVTLTVTQQPLPQWASSPLPTNTYWTRPINGQNREWAFIASDWLGGSSPVNKYQPYGIAPNSGHILWAKPLTFGGVTGGQFKDVAYYDGLSYESKFPSPVIIQDKLYYNEYPTPRYPIDKYPTGFYCVDLATGQVAYWKNSTVSFGQTYDIETPNEHGTVSYLWTTSGTTWHMFDAFNGNDLSTITHVPSGTTVTASDGSILIYQLGPKNAWLACWNSTTAIMYHSIQAGSNYYWNFRPEFGATYDGVKGYDWNVTLPSSVPSDAYVMDANSGILLMTTGLATGPGGVGIGGTPTTYVQCGISLSSSSPGTVVWSIIRNAAPGNVTITYGTSGNGVYVMRAKETMQWYGYSVTTGQQLWGPTDSQQQWDVYGMGGNIAGDTLYSCGYSGILYAYNIHTGKLLWTFSSGGGGFDVYYGNFPLSVGAIADGKVYLYSTEHSPSKPAWRGSSIICVNATSGKEIWRVENWANGIMVADGYLVDLNSYDNQIYCFGKGQTATTVTGPTTGVSQGTTVMIQGTVTDQSPGIGKGTPAISDDSMNAWMNYLYEQQIKPTNATGVKVHLTALDSNGNTEEIGVVTSDMSGLYSTSWTPPIDGKYIITASFDGSNSYYASSAETAMLVSTAASPAAASPTVTAAPTATPAVLTPTPTSVVTVAPTPSPVVVPPTSATPTATYIAIGAVVIIIIAVAAAIALRRRK
ncbi:MAG TPA: PQQ-binding-like beta-propeller repeat protein [Candidatus Nanoarchaeia archaeon]|nr:PQQ-binding-like beta-propeller repeat protein [Candidatus Nanoarchaeia archaeon]